MREEPASPSLSKSTTDSKADPAYAGCRPATEQVFEEPWQAQVFSMAVTLSEAGFFSWPEWVARFAQEPEEADRTYYERWLAALEGILADRALLAPEELKKRQDLWRQAALATPHGQPIVIDHGLA